MQKVSVIGTAGRSIDEDMNLTLYNRMIEKTKEIIIFEFGLDPNQIQLISGGAAWSDHIVIDLFLENFCNKVKIFSPTDWDFEKTQYKESMYKYDPGKISNYHHKQFSIKTKKNTLKEIESSIKKGLEFDSSNKGFKNRNSEIAKSEFLIAFSWGKDKPLSPGTLDTWLKSKSENKIHVSLLDL